MFCSNCGHELKPGVSFCAKCGTKVASKEAPNTSDLGATSSGSIGSNMFGSGTTSSIGSNTFGSGATGSGTTSTTTSAGTGPAVGPTTSAFPQMDGNSVYRMAEGALSCLNIILALVLPVVSISISFFGTSTQEMNIIDTLQLPGKLENMFKSYMGSSGSASSGLSSLSAACGFVGFMLIVAIVCSGITAFFCFTKNSDKRYPMTFAMAAYAIVLMIVLSSISGQLASQLSEMGGGFIDTSEVFKLDMGAGVWISLIGGIACIALDFVRVSKAQSETA